MEVVSVVAGSPAAAAGIRPEDIVFEVDGVPVDDVGDLQGVMSAGRIGRPVSMGVVRTGELRTVEVVPEELQG